MMVPAGRLLLPEMVMGKSISASFRNMADGDSIDIDSLFSAQSGMVVRARHKPACQNNRKTGPAARKESLFIVLI